MRPLVAVALLVPLVGCAKKPAPVAVAAADTPAPPATPQPAKPDAGTKAGEKSKPAEKPNWLNDPRYQKPAAADREPPAESATGKPGWGVAPPAGGWDKPADGQLPGFPPVGPPPVGAAAAAPAPKPAATPAKADKPGGRAVTRADLNDVWVFIENASQSGKMPGPDLVYAALRAAKSPAAELVWDGSIFLTGARQREGFWAFDRHAPTRGGWVATHQGPEFLTAEQFAARAGR